MENAEHEKGILISMEEFEKFNQLKAFRRNAIEQFDLIKILMFRLNVFINLLMENDDEGEEIIANIQMAIEELNYSCDGYKNLLENELPKNGT